MAISASVSNMKGSLLRRPALVSGYLVGCCLWLLSGSSILAQAYTPKRGSKERTAILDAIRDPLEEHVHQKVIFVVDHLKVENDWAFLMATPKTKDGGQINYKGTSLEDDAEFADEITVALLHKKRGRWFVVTHSFFTTDVWWDGLWNHFDAPRSIFP